MQSVIDRTLLTTGQIAAILQCAPRTVCRWIDRGWLRGYVLPGVGRHRRVTWGALREFCQEHGMPLPELDDDDPPPAAPAALHEAA